MAIKVLKKFKDMEKKRESTQTKAQKKTTEGSVISPQPPCSFDIC